MKTLMLAAAVFASLAAAPCQAKTSTQKPKDVSLDDYFAASCVNIDPVIVGKIKNPSVFEAYSTNTLRTDDSSSFIYRGTHFVIITKTFAFTGAGQAWNLKLLRKGQLKMPLLNGFETSAWVFEESKKCEDLWDAFVKTNEREAATK